MRYEVTFKHPSTDLDPRDAGTVADWIASTPAGLAITASQLLELAHRMARDLAHPIVKVDGSAVTVDDPDEGVTMRLAPMGGTCAVEDLENERSTLEVLCQQTGWVGFDPTRGAIVVGFDLVCDCESAIPPSETSCGVCGAPASDARLPR